MMEIKRTRERELSTAPFIADAQDVDIVTMQQLVALSTSVAALIEKLYEQLERYKAQEKTRLSTEGQAGSHLGAQATVPQPQPGPQ